MPFSLLPKIIANRLTDITPELLHSPGHPVADAGF